MKAQRLRLRYRIGRQAVSLSQRELVTAWADALKAAGLPLSCSEGKRPAPQISLAAPLPADVTSDWEYADVFLGERLDRRAARQALAGRLPPGIELVEVEEVGVGAPSLQSQLRWAEYEVEVPADLVSAEELGRAVQALLAADTLPAVYRRETKERQYDLRPLVLDLRLGGGRAGSHLLRMRLRAEPQATGRADQVLLALGALPALRIHRTRLYAEEAQPAILAYRRLGEPDDD